MAHAPDHGTQQRAAHAAEEDPLLWPKFLLLAAATALVTWAILKTGQPGGMPPGHRFPAPHAPWAGSAAARVERELPGGARIRVPAGGAEAALLDLLADPGRPPDRETWIELDRVGFEPGSAALQAASQEQLQAVAEILKAYPGVRITVGGSTSSAGEPAQGQRLSEARAANVRGMLLNHGVQPDRLGAEGYGEARPAGEAPGAPGRVHGRRMSIRVTGR